MVYVICEGVGLLGSVAKKYGPEMQVLARGHADGQRKLLQHGNMLKSACEQWW